MFSDEWKLPLNLAVGIHVLVVLGGLYLPELLKAKPKFADIYTVSIINVMEPSGPPPSQPPPTQPEETPAATSVTPPDTAEKVAPIAEVVKKQSTPQPPISLKPRKKKKKIIPVETEPVKPQRDLAREKREKLARALREEELLVQKARLAQEALARERALLQPVNQGATAPPSGTAPSTATTGSGSSGGSSSLIESQYLASIINRIHQFWALPVSLEKNTRLNAYVVVVINKSGKLTEMYFENRSGDRLFDQFVSKTLEAAAPLPPIPPAMKKKSIELGLHFKPGGIQ